MVLSVVATALVATMRGSPLTPPLLRGDGPTPLLTGLGSGIGLGRLSAAGAADLSILLMALSSAAFVFGLREAWHGRVSMRTVLWLGIGFQVAMAALPLLLSRDVYSYALYGRIGAVYHQNPYTATPLHFRHDALFPLVGPVWRNTPAVYGPAFTLLSFGLARAISSPVGLVWAFKVIAGLSGVGTLLLVAWLAKRVAPRRAAFAVAMFGWNPAILAYAVGGGHNDLLVALCLAAALAVLVRGGVFERIRDPVAAAVRGGVGHELVAVGLLTLGALVKASAGPALALAVVAIVAARPRGARWRVGAMAVGVSVGLTVAFAAPYWQTSNPTLGLSELATHRGWVTATRLLLATLGGIAENLFGTAGRSVVEAVIRVSFTVVAFASLGLIAAAVVRRVRRSSKDPVGSGPPWTAGAEGASWAWALLVFVLAAPVLLPWYVAWALPVAWLLPRGGRALLVGMSCLLAVTHAVVEPELVPHQYRFVLWFGHDVVGPVMLVAFVWIVRRVIALARGRLPLDDLGAGPAAPAVEHVAPRPDGD
jgi:hypothetical protein